MSKKAATTNNVGRDLARMLTDIQARIVWLNGLAEGNEEVLDALAQIHTEAQVLGLANMQLEAMLSRLASQMEQVREQRDQAYARERTAYARGQLMNRHQMAARIVAHNPRLNEHDVMRVLEYLQGEAPGGRAAPVSEYYVEQVIEAWAELAAAILEEQGNNRASGE